VTTSGTPELQVLFAIAAGPLIGFGHFGRTRALARTLAVPHVVAVAGTAATRRILAAAGATIVPASVDVEDVDADAIDRVAPHVVVVDDPSAERARRWVSLARRRHVPVASIHDLGHGHVESDLVVDASLTGVVKGARGVTPHLLGPAFTVLDPLFSRPAEAERRRRRVLIALGGGSHVLRFGAALAEGICRVLPDVRVVIAPGFSTGRRPALPEGGSWLGDPRSLPDELRRCTAAVVGGGITLSEACAVGTPVVGVAVTPAQHRTIRAFAAAGAVIDGGLAGTPGTARRVASSIVALVTGEPSVSRQIARAQRLVDGRGAQRVADAIAALVVAGHRARQAGERTHAA
jgi:spore coat polysaccharide biosynthesis predicted glycosyltransferase SpsG